MGQPLLQLDSHFTVAQCFAGCYCLKRKGFSSESVCLDVTSLEVWFGHCMCLITFVKPKLMTPGYVRPALNAARLHC